MPSLWTASSARVEVVPLPITADEAFCRWTSAGLSRERPGRTDAIGAARLAQCNVALPSQRSTARGLAVSLLEDLPSLGFQAKTKPLNGRKGQVLLAPLNGAVIGPMHPNMGREALLAEAKRLASAPDAGTNPALKGVCSHADTLRTRLFKLYSTIDRLPISISPSVWPSQSLSTPN